MHIYPAARAHVHVGSHAGSLLLLPLLALCAHLTCSATSVVYTKSSGAADRLTAALLRTPRLAACWRAAMEGAAGCNVTPCNRRTGAASCAKQPPEAADLQAGMRHACCASPARHHPAARWTLDAECSQWVGTATTVYQHDVAAHGATGVTISRGTQR